jgi:hypothetical protein
MSQHITLAELGLELNHAKSLGKVGKGHFPSADECLEYYLEEMGNDASKSEIDTNLLKKRISVVGVGKRRESVEENIVVSVSDPLVLMSDTLSLIQRPKRALSREEFGTFLGGEKTVRSERWRRWVIRQVFLMLLKNSTNRRRQIFIELFSWYSSYDFGDLPLTVEEVEETLHEGRPVFIPSEEEMKKLLGSDKARITLNDSKHRRLWKTHEKFMENVEGGETDRDILEPLLKDAMPRRADFLADFKDLVTMDIDLISEMLDREIVLDAEIATLMGDENAKARLAKEKERNLYRRRRPVVLQRRLGLRQEPALYQKLACSPSREEDSYLTIKEGEKVSITASTLSVKLPPIAGGLKEEWTWYGNTSEVQDPLSSSPDRTLHRRILHKSPSENTEYYCKVTYTSSARVVIYEGISASKHVTVLRWCKRCRAWTRQNDGAICKWEYSLDDNLPPESRNNDLANFDWEKDLRGAAKQAGFSGWIAGERIAYRYGNFIKPTEVKLLTTIPRHSPQHGLEKWEGKHNFEYAAPDLPKKDAEGKITRGSVRKLFVGDLVQYESEEDFKKILSVYLR